jgi:hypothetical protein
MIEESINHLNLPLQNLKEIAKNLDGVESEKFMITSRWNLNETVAHLIGWAGQFRDEIKFLLETKNIDFPWHISAKNNWTEFNDKNVQKYHRSDLLELIKMFEEINDEIIKLIQESKDSDQLEIKHEIKYYGKFSPVSIHQMLKMKAHHEWEHLKQIKEKLKNIA